MATTELVQLPYPDEGDDPFFDKFEALVGAIDAAGYAAREDKNLVLMGSAALYWNSTSGIFSWVGSLVLVSSETGNSWEIPTGSVSLLTEGQLAFVRLPRAPQSTQMLSMQTASALADVPDADSLVLIAIRRSGRLALRNGRVVGSGSVVALNPIRRPLVMPLFTGVYSLASVFKTIGAMLLKSSDAATRQVFLRAILRCGGSFTAAVQLIDPNNVLGGGANAVVPGSSLSTTSTTEVEVEAELTALEGLGSDILLLAQFKGVNIASSCNGLGLYLV